MDHLFCTKCDNLLNTKVDKQTVSEGEEPPTTQKRRSLPTTKEGRSPPTTKEERSTQPGLAQKYIYI